MVRLGAPVESQSPESWISALKAAGYRAAYCPFDASTDRETIRAYMQLAEDADIVISEVGAWSNPINTDDQKRQDAIEKCQRQLALAEEIGARCCVNISGSRAEQWDGPHPDNLTQEIFDLIVETVRTIIDSVKPTRTFYTLEPMPWAYPESIESYLALLKAVDRPTFAVHLDPVNWMDSPSKVLKNGEYMREMFRQLGSHIKVCHAKDMQLAPRLTVHIDEVRPGLGVLDYRTLLTCMNQLNDVPLMLEHLPMEEYAPSAEFVRSIATELNIPL